MRRFRGSFLLPYAPVPGMGIQFMCPRVCFIFSSEGNFCRFLFSVGNNGNNLKKSNSGRLEFVKKYGNILLFYVLYVSIVIFINFKLYLNKKNIFIITLLYFALSIFNFSL